MYEQTAGHAAGDEVDDGGTHEEEDRGQGRQQVPRHLASSMTLKVQQPKQPTILSMDTKQHSIMDIE
jgi:hypothetical protein